MTIKLILKNAGRYEMLCQTTSEMHSGSRARSRARRSSSSRETGPRCRTQIATSFTAVNACF